MKVIHYFKVARHFNIFQHEFYLALCHDLVEDGYIGQCFLKYWKSLNAITRRKEETYMQYITRLSVDNTAKQVKLADLKENMLRCNDSLKKRYVKAYSYLLFNFYT